ncbi:MAG: hypothetical protein ACJ71W_10640 [Terriglobales bacterium]
MPEKKKKTKPKKTPKTKKANRYQAILVNIFLSHFKDDEKDFFFERTEIQAVAKKLKIILPKNIGDVLYSQRYRAEWPEKIKATIPNGHDWLILPAGKGRYRFKLIRGSSRVLPRLDAADIKVPDATPEIIAAYAQGDEQAVLARIRYNRLVDTFLGITAYSLQNHFRTSVDGMGQIEIDELYVGVNREGQQYIIPVQAKGGSDQLSIIQAIQDIACCREKFPHLTCRSVSAQFMPDGVIAMFELREEEDGVPRVAEERHYHLVPFGEIETSDLDRYRLK